MPVSENMSVIKNIVHYCKQMAGCKHNKQLDTQRIALGEICPENQSNRDMPRDRERYVPSQNCPRKSNTVITTPTNSMY